MSYDLKAEILAHLDIESYFRQAVENLKPIHGDEFIACCPFHEDNNPSLSVNVKTGLYYCHACGAKGDLYGFHMRRHGVDFKTALAELGRLAGIELKPKKKRESKQAQKQLKTSNSNDHGLAVRLANQRGPNMRYIHLAKKWYFWNGKYWQIDSCGQIARWAIQTVQSIYKEAAEAENPEESFRLARFANASLAAARLQAMVKIAQDLSGLQVQPKELNADPWKFNCRNGTIDLKTGKLLPHNPDDLITYMAPYDYVPEASCDLWERFLFQIMDYEQRPDTAARMTSFLQQALGYSLTGDCREECLFILWGGGANGKSTLVNVITEILGDYSRNTPVESLLSRPKGGEIPTDIARLDGPRFVTSQEVDRGRRLAESLVKALTGRDTISARFLYGEFFDFIPQFKLWLSTNNKPVIKGADDAIWRRIMFLRFPVHFNREQRDLNLKEKLLTEGSGILAWVVRGCLDWQKHGFDIPPEVIEDLREYRSEMDVLADWIEEYCLVNPANLASASDLYASYQDWAEEAGLKDKEILTRKTFGVCLTERGFIRDRGAGGQRIWKGVSLRLPAE